MKTRPYGHGLCSISSGVLLQDVTLFWQYLTSSGFRNYVASANLYFGFVINYSYSDVWELLMNCCNKCCVMLNHYDLGCSRFGLKSLVILWTTVVIRAQVREFDRFGDCFWTCALIIRTVPWHPPPGWPPHIGGQSGPSSWIVPPPPLRINNNRSSRSVWSQGCGAS
jgi:hypothetical protein